MREEEKEGGGEGARRRRREEESEGRDEHTHAGQVRAEQRKVLLHTFISYEILWLDEMRGTTVKMYAYI